ncbi:MAG TPA: TonB family protein [Chitinophagaceae bacterium]|nr:TonB family protein [Chitinophagaceae bacterium]
MSEEKKYKTYTAVDIEKYHRGLLSPKEMHELEKAALDDPFLADALEGYGATTVNGASDLLELEKKLQERISDAKVISMVPPRNSFKWWKVAAAVIVIGSGGFLAFWLTANNENKSVAILEEKKSKPESIAPIVDSSTLKTTDTTYLGTISKTLGRKETSTSEKELQNKSSGVYISVDSGDNNLTATTSSSPTVVGNTQPQLQELKIKDSTKALSGLGVRNEDVAVLKKSAEKSKMPSAQMPTKDNNGLLNDNYKKSEVNAAESFKFNQAAVDKKIGIPVTNYFRGRVVDANNNPLPFANITNTHDNVGTYSDAKGYFTLISPDSALNVQVRSIGFENNLAKLRNNVVINQVVMQDDKVSPDKIISRQKMDTNRSRTANIKFEELEPADGWANYDTYLANNIKVPDDLKIKRDNGQVKVSFEVNQNGDPVNIKVEESLCQKCDEEAIRLVKEGPKWKKKNKKAKRVTITVPFDIDQ